jgi:mannose-6-phosphate isomerase-like protein (cupin superfamily)
MKTRHVMIMVISMALITAASVLAVAGEKTMVVPFAELQWKEMGIPGVTAAPVSGDMEKGPSRFFLKYASGLVTPMHHHTSDHFVVLVSGSVTMTVEGKDYKLGPGSYFALVQKAPHLTRVEGTEPAVFYITADAPWDVVLEEKK